MSSGQFNINEILQTNADLQRQIDANSIPDLPQKGDEKTKNLVYTLADSGWLSTRTTGISLTNKQGNTVPQSLSISYETNINIPSYLLPFIKTEIIVQPPVGVKIVGLWSGKLYEINNVIEIEGYVKGLAFNNPNNGFYDTGSSEIKTPYSFYFIKDKDVKWDYITNKKNVYALSIDYNYNGNRYRILNAPISLISTICSPWPFDGGHNTTFSEGLLYSSASYEDFGDLAIGIGWPPGIIGNFQFNYLDAAANLDNIHVSGSIITFDCATAHFSIYTSTPSPFYFDGFTTWAFPVIPQFPSYLVAEPHSYVEFNTTCTTNITNCIFGFDTGWGIPSQEKFVNGKWVSTLDRGLYYQIHYFGNSTQKTLNFWDDIVGNFPGVSINSASVQIVGYVPCYALEVPIILTGQDSNIPPNISIFNYNTNYTITDEIFGFNPPEISDVAFYKKDGLWNYYDGALIISTPASLTPFAGEQIIPSIDVIREHSVQVFPGNDKNTGIFLSPIASGETIISNTIQNYNVSVNDIVVLSCLANKPSDGDFTKVIFDGTVIPDTLIQAVTTSTNPVSGLFGSPLLDCLYKVRVNLVLPFYYKTQEGIIKNG